MRSNSQDIYGGDFSDFIKKISTGASNLFQNIKGRLSGQRNDYPPSVRKWFADNGSKMITNITLYRSPVNSLILKTLNIISLGAFKEKLKKLGFDKMFHLYLKLDFGNNESALVEKNEVINIRSWRNSDSSDNTLKFNSIPSIPVNVFFQNAQIMMGDRYFIYDAFTNNCQVYLQSLLKANNLLTPEADKFIFQDVTTLSKELPGLSKFARFTTDTASKIDTLIKGKGLKKAKLTM